MIKKALGCNPRASIFLPLFLSPAHCGFPSPAEDYIEKTLDLNEYLIQHPASTFFVRAKGDSMINAGIFHGDILIVDRSKEAVHNAIVVAVVNGEFTVKRLCKQSGVIVLCPENPKYSTIEITHATDFEVWGVVAHVIHEV